MKQIILILLFVFTHILIAQEWSEPVNISNTSGIDENPEFSIDNNGVLHCVWTYKISTYFRKIYYSKSEDDGETWSTPLNISQNNEFWMGLPHIVSDSQNNLYVAYLHNVAGTGDTPRIYFTKFDGSGWSIPCSISGNYGGVGMSDLAIDNSDRVYVFWHWGGSTGEIYYRYLEDNEWSEIFCPYENTDHQYTLAEAVVDANNNIHAIIDHHPPDTGSRAAYIKYDYASDTWEDAAILGIRRFQQGADIALDSNDYPHLVWREYTNDLIPPNDGTFYSCFNGTGFTHPVVLVEDPWWQVIAVDSNDVIHLVEVEKYDTGLDIVKNLVYYNNINSIWGGEIIFESENSAGLPKLEIFENKLFLVFFNSNSVTGSDVYFMKKALLTNSTSEFHNIELSAIRLSQNFPNPFNPVTQINFTLNQAGQTSLKILNVKGQLIRKLVDSFQTAGEYSAIWDGTNKAGKQVANGVYYYRLQVDDRVMTKSLTLVK